MTPATEAVDLDMVTKIRLEAFNDSKVMETASELMDRIGPRLTGSPQMKQANEWTKDQLAGWGLALAVSSFTPLPARITLWSVGVALALGGGAGVVFGVFPAARAARLDPITAMRAE